MRSTRTCPSFARDEQAVGAAQARFDLRRRRHDEEHGVAGTADLRWSEAGATSCGKTGAPESLRIDVERRPQQTGAVEIGGDAPAHLAEPDHADRPASCRCSIADEPFVSRCVARRSRRSATFVWTIQAVRSIRRRVHHAGMRESGRMAETIIRMGGYQGARSVHTRAGRILGREFLERAGDGYRFDFREDVTALGRPSMDLFAHGRRRRAGPLLFRVELSGASRCPTSRSSICPSGSAAGRMIYPKLDGALGRPPGGARSPKTPASCCSDIGTTGFATSPTACGRSAGPRIAEACRSGR